MSRKEMLEKMVSRSGIVVEAVSFKDEVFYYFFEDRENSPGITRAMQELYSMIKIGAYMKLTFISNQE